MPDDSKLRFSLTTNASLLDGSMLAHIVPHWLRVFGQHLSEIIVVVDRQPPTGRIAQLHSDINSAETLDPVLDHLSRLDARVRCVELNTIELSDLQKRWFGRARPVRCQTGSPISAFVAAIEQAASELVLRCDSDVLFHESGWLREADELLGTTTDLYEPPRLHIPPAAEVSTRALLLKPSIFAHCLPLRHKSLDLLRVVHRRLHHRPPWLSLEKMLQRGAMHCELRHVIGRDQTKGFSLHALRRSYALQPWFPDVIHAVETGSLPSAQCGSWDLNPDLWPFSGAF